MMKTRLIAMAMASLVLIYTGCSEKEVANPVEDSARIDQLRNELRQLQLSVYGVELENSALNNDSTDLATTLTALEEEVAKLQTQFNKAVSYTVIAIDNLGNPISGASVTLNQNGDLVTKTTDNTGSVQFSDVRAGTLAAVVKATNYATVNYFATLAFANVAGVNSRIVMIPKAGSTNTYSLKGFLYANTNLANDTAGGKHYYGTPFIGFKGTDPATKNPGAANDNRTYEKVVKKIKATLYCDINYVPFSRATGNGGNSADLIELAYEDASVEAIFDNSNQYTLTLPLTSIYKDYSDDNVVYSWEISFEEFLADQVLVDYDPNGILDGGAPAHAWPMPKTYTAKKLYKLYDKYDDSDDEDRQPGDVFTIDFFYNAYNL